MLLPHYYAQNNAGIMCKTLLAIKDLTRIRPTDPKAGNAMIRRDAKRKKEEMP